MATEADIQQVENIIKYSFLSKKYLRQALTAAGAEEGDDYEGNRLLALYGTRLVSFLLTELMLESDLSRAEISNLETTSFTKEQRMSVAEQTGIDKHVKYNTRGGNTRNALAATINAILGSVYKDSRNAATVWKVIFEMGLIPETFHEKIHTTTNMEIDHSSRIGQEVLSIESRGNTSEDLGTAPNVLSPTLGDDSLLYSPSADNTSRMQEFFPSNIEYPSGISQSSQAGSVVRISSNEPDVFDRFCDGTMLDDAWAETTTQNHSPISASNSSTTFISVHAESNLPTPVSHYTEKVPPMVNIVPGSTIWPGAEDVSRATSTLSPQKRKPSHSVDRSKRRRSSQHPQSDQEKLDHYIADEAEKCRRRHYRLPQTTFFTETIRTNVLELGKRSVDIGKILISIASSESIATIWDLLHMCRTQRNLQLWYPHQEISSVERFRIIEDLDRNIAGLNLLRRHHLLRLFEECGGPDAWSGGNIIVATKSNFNSRTETGNSRRLAKARVAEIMMKAIFPAIKHGHKEYNRKLRKVKVARTLGVRLYILSRKFGPGIVDLIPVDLLDGHFSAGISDRMILNLPDNAFDDLVWLLERSQGSLLRQFSDAVFRISKPLLDGTLQQALFTIEKQERAEIVGCPKGSQALLDLIQ